MSFIGLFENPILQDCFRKTFSTNQKDQISSHCSIFLKSEKEKKKS